MSTNKKKGAEAVAPARPPVRTPIKETDMPIVDPTNVPVSLHRHGAGGQVTSVTDGAKRITSYGYILMMPEEIIAVVFASDDADVADHAKRVLTRRASYISTGHLPDPEECFPYVATINSDGQAPRRVECVKTDVTETEYVSLCVEPACDTYGNAHVMTFDDDSPIHTIDCGSMVELNRYDDIPWQMAVRDLEVMGDEMAEFAEQVQKAANLAAGLNGKNGRAG